MPEFFLELFSEEIPARMQAAAAEELELICEMALGRLAVQRSRTFVGPRRIGISCSVNDTDGGGGVLEIKGPRDKAPDAAVEGFVKKHTMSRSDLFIRDGSFFLNKKTIERSASETIKTELSMALSKSFRWPKSMRWGQSQDFTWVRPLRRVICLLDNEVVPITVGPITASNETEGHRSHANSIFSVSSATDWEEKLRDHNVYADEDVRLSFITQGLGDLAAKFDLTIFQDADLAREVTGLVEWPIPLIGKIDPQFMSLPSEVRELSMRVNQKYFALRDADGNPAPYFAFVANQEAPDGGAAIIAGNERVLRARLSDAQHFWDIDLKTPLDALLPKLDKITFHAKIGSQAERVKRIEALAREIANLLAANLQEAEQAQWAGLLCKADLVTGMVGEFPELQGIMGGYYAEKNPHGWDGNVVGQAIKTHYQPKGPSDAVPTGTLPCAVALADKLDTLREFFRIGEKPTGSSDPYALRRAALGVIRIILENNLRFPLEPLLHGDGSLFDFIIERLRIKLRGEGKRYDVLDAVLASGADDDLVRVMKRVDALGAMLNTDDGKSLLAAYRRAGNILKIETAKTDDFKGVTDPGLLALNEERALAGLLGKLNQPLQDDLKKDDFTAMMEKLSSFRAPVDNFFENVTVNADAPELRRNRLRLLSDFIDTVDHVADFSKIAA